MSHNWKWGFGLALVVDVLLVTSIWLARRLHLMEAESLLELSDSIFDIAAPLLVPLLIVSFVLIFIHSESS